MEAEPPDMRYQALPGNEYNHLGLLYTRKERDIAASAGDGAAGELISHSCTAGQQPREPVGATRNKPAVGPAYNGPGTGLLRRVQDRTSSSKHQFTPDRGLFRPCLSFHQLS